MTKVIGHYSKVKSSCQLSRTLKILLGMTVMCRKDAMASGTTNTDHKA